MGELQKSNGGLLEKGIDMMKDPKTTKAGKIGAVAIIAIGAITVMGKTAIDAMSK